MNIAWQFSNDKPIYAQIVSQVKQLIVSGNLKAGDKMPTVRELASEAEVNPNTMQRALSELENEGLLSSHRVKGRFVTEDEKLIKTMKDEIADKKVSEFLKSMKLLGYTKEETEDLIKSFKED